MYRIYYIKNNYMFRHFTLAFFRLRNEKKLVSSYTRLMWVVYSGEVRGEVGARVEVIRLISTLVATGIPQRTRSLRTLSTSSESPTFK